VKRILLVLYLALFSGDVAFSQPGTSSALCTASGQQDYPALTHDGFGNIIVVWHDRRDGDSSGGTDLYAQKLNLFGEILWQTDGVPVCTEPSNQGGQFTADGLFASGVGAVQIAPDGSGGAIIAWRDDRNGALNGDIFAQRVYSNGQTAWNSAGVPVCTAANDQTYLRMISDGAGGAIITWEDFRLGNSVDIYAQRIDGRGRIQWQTDGVAVCSANDAQRGPQIVTDAQGGAIVAWIDLRHPILPPQYDVYAQRISSAGATQWASNGAPICTARDDQYLNFQASMVADGSGGAIIAWHDERAGGFGFQDIYAQRVDDQGATLWQDNGAPVCTAPGQQANPVIAADGGGGAFIVWPDLRDHSFELHGYIQRLDESGQARFSQNGLLVSGTPTQFPLAISTTPGNAAALWLDAREADKNIYAQTYDSTGATAFPPGGERFAGGENTELAVVAAHVTDGAFVASWQDLRNVSDWDIYAAVGSPLPIGESPIAVSDRFVDSGPEPKFLPILRNDVLPTGQEVQITITTPPKHGTILSIEEDGIWYQTDREVVDEFGYELTVARQQSSTDEFVRGDATVSRQSGSIIIQAFLCVCQLVAECASEELNILQMLAQSAPSRPYAADADSLELDLLLRARDEILGVTSIGGQLVQTFMFNSPEILQVLVIDRPDLLNQTLTTLEMLQEPARSLLDGDGSELLPQALIDTIQNLLISLGGSLSDELGQELQQTLAPLGNLDDYAGMTVGQAAASAFDYPTKVTEDNPSAPARFELSPNYPNPFNPSTTISYRVQHAARVKLLVYDILGRQVATLVNERQVPGEYSVSFMADGLSSGVYFARLQSGKRLLQRKMLLLR